ncbi:MAG: hypothetical protein QGI68_05350 [Pseudomonadales bacterium]|jgi:hypothetical protein|nr:hypothetical protein [Pseudomonadales bacterium]MDP7594979.1 hypothetical protein [Pseudomonadales bacterium]
MANVNDNTQPSISAVPDDPNVSTFTHLFDALSTFTPDGFSYQADPALLKEVRRFFGMHCQRQFKTDPL